MSPSIKCISLFTIHILIRNLVLQTSFYWAATSIRSLRPNSRCQSSVLIKMNIFTSSRLSSVTRLSIINYLLLRSLLQPLLVSCSSWRRHIGDTTHIRLRFKIPFLRFLNDLFLILNYKIIFLSCLIHEVPHFIIILWESYILNLFLTIG